MRRPVLMLLSVIAAWPGADQAMAQRGTWPYVDSRFSAVVTASEYDALRAAAMHGVTRYGGDVSHHAKLFASPPGSGNLVWEVTWTGQRTIDAWAFWSAEQTTRLLTHVNLDNLDDDTLAALKVLQTLNLKLEQAKANPLWELTTAVATVALKEPPPQPAAASNSTAATAATYVLTSGDDTVDAVGPAATSLGALVGKRAVVKGYVKAPGTIELVSATAVRENTLELVIMSQCPFGVRAADAVIEHLKSPGHLGVSALSPPRLDVRYIFYRKQDATAGGSTKHTWWSLHGDAEIDENLVQMAIRDVYPDRFGEYVQRRSQNPTQPWRTVAMMAGLGGGDADAVAAHVEAHREQMIADEFAYVSGTLGIADGSPAFVWESKRVIDLRTVPAFKAIDLNAGSCAGGTRH